MTPARRGHATSSREREAKRLLAAPPRGATVTTVTTTATSYAAGVSYAALPAGSMAAGKNGTTCYLNGNTGFQQLCGANGAHYQVVPAP